MGVFSVEFDRDFAKSELFKGMFRDGMALVEETAQYLEGKGKLESRRLSRSISLLYATESMRLTTRLMQMTSWLLVLRAVTDNELTMEEAVKEKQEINLEKIGTLKKVENFEELPLGLQELITRTLGLYHKIKRVEQMMNSAKDVDENGSVNPVNDQIKILKSAFNN